MDGTPIGDPVRCTRECGHRLDLGSGSGYRELHENLRPGRKVRWPDSAAVKL